MFYENKLNLKNITYSVKKYASFTNGINSDYDENLLPIKYSPLTYNFDYSDGSLKDGMGLSVPKFRYAENFPDRFKEIVWPATEVVTGCWLYPFWNKDMNMHTEMLVVYTVKGNFYYNNLKESSKEMVLIDGMKFTEKPRVLTYNLDGVDTLIMVSQKDGMYVWEYGKSPVKIEDAPLISSMCIHFERLFATTFGEKRSVIFSDDLNPTNFNINSRDGGFIELIDEFGKSNKVISFNGYLYVFRDFNVARVVAFGNQQEFSVEQLYLSNGRIYDKTVAVCGNKIIYLASDGLFSFNGSSASKINLNIDNLLIGVENDNAVASYCDGYYYLICTLNYNDGKVMHENYNQTMINNTLIRINASTGEFSLLRGYNFTDLFLIKYVLGSEMLVSVSDNGLTRMLMIDNSGMYRGEPTHKVWNSPLSDFGYPDRDKLIREINLESLSDITLQIKTENETKNYTIKGKVGYQKINPYIKGRRIAINFISDSICNKISNPQVVVGYL